MPDLTVLDLTNLALAAVDDARADQAIAPLPLDRVQGPDSGVVLARALWSLAWMISAGLPPWTRSVVELLIDDVEADLEALIQDEARDQDEVLTSALTLAREALSVAAQGRLRH